MKPLPTTRSFENTSAISAGAAVLAIGAVYVYFLIFAEFAFLENLTSVVGQSQLQPLMAALGLAGIGGSIISAKWFDMRRGRNQLIAGFAGCALSAGLSLVANSSALAFVAAIAVGASLSWTTVILSLCLNATVSTRRLGLGCGIGTGIAYALCNQPLVFNASSQVQTWVAITAALLGLFAALRLRCQPIKFCTAPEYRPGICALWVLLFFTLVWIDSAAFFVIQHTNNLKESTWHGTAILQGNALIHLLAAITAGWLLDQQKQPLAIAIALLLLLSACVLLSFHHAFPVARFMYTAGVSIYSTALVFYPAKSGRPWLAGLIYAASGWFGSAMGIGMAQSLQGIPHSFVAIAAVIGTLTLALRAGKLRGVHLQRTLVLLIAFFLLVNPQHSQAQESVVALGREVYVSEGCIHCHSQYVRPESSDLQRWGSPTSLEDSLKQTPPLFGNRRQGPDLSQVGSRRSPEWNYLHLQAPRSLVPGSRMPSYGHLFKNGDPRGPALLAYLDTLGKPEISTRLKLIQTWIPAASAAVLPLEKQKALFTELCASCHGPQGHGNGPLAVKLSLRPPNFAQDGWRHISESEADPVLKLGRIIKFGQIGTPMAGHEYLNDSEIISLAHFVYSLHRTNQ